MTRFYRSIIALFLGLLLGGFATYASAETIPAITGQQVSYTDKWHLPSEGYYNGTEAGARAEISRVIAYYAALQPPSTCAVFNSYPFGQVTYGSSFVRETYQQGNGTGCLGAGLLEQRTCPAGYTLLPDFSACSGGTGYSCPISGGWTLSGSNCTRPDCGPGQTRDASGQCISQACPTGQFSSGYYQGSVPGAACTASGCMVSFSGTYPAGRDPQGNLYASGSYSYMGGNQGECTPGSGSVAVPATATTTPTTTAPLSLIHISEPTRPY